MNTEDTNKGDSVNEEMIRKTVLLEKENENSLKNLRILKRNLKQLITNIVKLNPPESLRKEAEAKN